MPGTPMIVQMLASSPMLISVLNSVLIGAIVALSILQVGGDTLIAVVGSVIAFVLGIGAFLAYARREITAVRTDFEPRFPTKVPADT